VFCVLCEVNPEVLCYLDRWLVVGLSTRSPVFDSRSVHVRYVVYKVALGQVFLQVIRMNPVGTNFDVLPTVHLSIILVINQLNEQIVIL